MPRRNSLVRLTKHAWKYRWKPVYPSDAWNPLHGLFWGFPIVFLITIFRCRRLRKVIGDA